jgi:hypothetical protein
MSNLRMGKMDVLRLNTGTVVAFGLFLEGKANVNV